MKNLSGKWIKVALFNFLIAASIGLLLRFAFVYELKWMPYKSFQDAHSNLALLGWIFQSVYACFAACFLPDNDKLNKKYSEIFIINQVLITLITLSFLFEISKIISNTLLICFSVSTVYYTITFYKDASGGQGRKPFSFILAIIGLIFLIMSFLGLYAITPILFLATAKKVLFYYLGVQFFLHFQYNGWFTFAILALIMRHAENKGIDFTSSEKKSFLILTIAGIIMNYFMTIYWGFRNHISYLWIASAGTILQILAIALIWSRLKLIWNVILELFHKNLRALLWFSMICFGLKLLMQLITIVPDIASLAFTIRNYVIAYLHMIFLGVMTFFILAWSLQNNLLSNRMISNAGIISLVLGFFLMEAILFIQGTMLWTGLGFLTFYYHIIFGVSLLLPLGLIHIIVKSRQALYH